MNEPEVQRCTVVDAPSDWPELRVLAVLHAQSTDGAVGREAARRRVRELLLGDAGPEIAAPLLAAARAAPGAGRASISHEPPHSLLAWCERGRIGIDAVSLHRLAGMSPHDVLTTAEQYLGPNVVAALMQATSAGQARTLFADAWARHEASVKCLGLVLDEWSPGLQGQLARCSTAVVAPPHHAGAGISVIRTAWRR